MACRRSRFWVSGHLDRSTVTARLAYTTKAAVRRSSTRLRGGTIRARSSVRQKMTTLPFHAGHQQRQGSLGHWQPQHSAGTDCAQRGRRGSRNPSRRGSKCYARLPAGRCVHGQRWRKGRSRSCPCPDSNLKRIHRKTRVADPKTSNRFASSCRLTPSQSLPLIEQPP